MIRMSYGLADGIYLHSEVETILKTVSPRSFLHELARQVPSMAHSITPNTHGILINFPWCLPTCYHKLGQASSSLGFREPTFVSHCQRLSLIRFRDRSDVIDRGGPRYSVNYGRLW